MFFKESDWFGWNLRVDFKTVVWTWEFVCLYIIYKFRQENALGQGKCGWCRGKCGLLFWKRLQGLNLLFEFDLFLGCGKVLWKSWNWAGFCCWIWLWKSGLGLLQVWDVVGGGLVGVWAFILQSVCEKITHRKAWKQRLLLWFFLRGTPKNPYFPVLCYNMGTGEGNGNANRTGTGRKAKFNRLSFRGIIRVSKGTDTKNRTGRHKPIFQSVEKSCYNKGVSRTQTWKSRLLSYW